MNEPLTMFKEYKSEWDKRYTSIPDEMYLPIVEKIESNIPLLDTEFSQIEMLFHSSYRVPNSGHWLYGLILDIMSAYIGKTETRIVKSFLTEDLKEIKSQSCPQ
jgi:hypothetical protein